MKIVADDRIPYLPGVFESCGVEVVYLPGREIASRHLVDADALIIRTRTRCDRSLLENTSVKMVATATIGCDHISAGDLADLDIHWCNAPGCNASSVQQYVCSALINIAEDWKGKTLGVVGVGHVGSLVARLGEILGMRVLLCDPPRSDKEGPSGFVDLETIASLSDVVTLHVPFETAGAYPTAGMIGTDFFRAMKPGGTFINSSRGEVVDEPALLDALTSEHIKNAVIDVWRNEPCINAALLKYAKYATPHIAGYSADGKANGSAAVIRAVAQFFGIEKLKGFSCVPPDVPENVIDLAGLSGAGALAAAVNCTYDVARDDSALRQSIGDFEKLRENYRFRREFPGFVLKNCPVECRELLSALGFKLEEEETC